ncbi:PREDICTED: BUD13 homolog [Crocodylus porosus]|uniref:BUD13 homolog n=1 Tax=Crocodylus porosus TaxID=8502 RepID=A0A7M4FQ61_CROPO|nr:PREDICTED: BUD13 homolog [Crocodylus porosus]
MAAAPGLSKAEYLRRYLGGPDAAPGGKRRKRRRKAPGGSGLRIVDDDVSWSSLGTAEGPERDEAEDDEGDQPVVAEFIDERPDEVKLMEEFRMNNKWKLLGEQDEDCRSSDRSLTVKSLTSSEVTKWKRNKISPNLSPPRRGRHDSPDPSPPRRGRHDSPKRTHSVSGRKGNRVADGSLPGGQSVPKTGFLEKLSSSQRRQVTPDLSPPRKNRHKSELEISLPQRKRPGSPGGPKRASSTRGSSPGSKKPQQALSSNRLQRHDSDASPPRKSAQNSDSDLSPPRRNLRPGHLHRDSSPGLGPSKRLRDKSSDSDLSPPRRSQASGKKHRSSRSPSDLSPPLRGRDCKGSPQRERREGQRASQMLSGGKAGLVSADLLRQEQQELRRRDKSNKHLEDESQNAATVFRDKSGRKRDLAQERLEQQKKAEEKASKDEQYAKWGKGLAQSKQQQQNMEDAIKEMQKPLARYIDDQDLDQMLREQEREGDPMANFIKKRKAKESKDKKEKPRYSGPAPPLNRFNIWPGYRWDGVDRSNGFEQKRFARLASKKAVQELAYKWSVEDM